MGSVDVWCQQVTDRFMKAPWLETLIRWTGMERQVPPPERLIAAMDEASVELALLSAWHGPQGSLISNDEVAETIAAYPDRFRGLASVDLNDPVAAVREVRRCVTDLGFVGVRVVPWLWDLPPNDRRYYPIYVTCVELGVPFCTQVGHTGPLCRSEPGRPIPYLDDVLIDFPELVIVAGHVGYPWIDEVLSLLRKYPNFYVDTSAYVLHRLPTDFVDYLRKEGRYRILFGTNWPMLHPAQCLRHLNELGLDEEAASSFVGDNARRLFGLDSSRTAEGTAL